MRNMYLGTMYPKGVYDWLEANAGLPASICCSKNFGAQPLVAAAVGRCERDGDALLVEAMTAERNRTVDEVFLAPLREAIDLADTRECPGYSDGDHIMSGTFRTLEKIESGREWVQRAKPDFAIETSTVSRFFKAANSPRRTATVEQVASRLARMADLSLGPGEDMLAAHSELGGFLAYSTDGHSIKASAHESEIQGKVRAPSHIYSLDLRTHSLHHVALCEPQSGKKKEHEMATLKRVDANAMRMGAPKGKKVIHSYDPAIVDYKQWQSWKHTKGVYIITMQKANSAFVVREDRDWERPDSRNAGVLADQTVGCNAGYAMRRVIYEDPVTQTVYNFVTTEMTLPPGLIAFLYKLRWDIEKVFDQNKNALGEDKAWTNSEVGKRQQACFICMAQSLFLIFERKIARDEGITDEKSLSKRRKRLAKDVAKARANGRTLSSLVSSCFRITKRSLQFLRWLRCCLRSKSLWSESVEDLRALMMKYIN